MRLTHFDCLLKFFIKALYMRIFVGAFIESSFPCAVFFLVFDLYKFSVEMF